MLHLQRPHWQTTVWLDNQPIGTNDSLGTPHDYDLTDLATPGDHRLSIRIDNRVNISVGLDAHSISDQTETDWNGIVGDISLRATDKIWIDNVQIYPNVAEKKSTSPCKSAITPMPPVMANSPPISPAGAAPKIIPIHWNATGNMIAFDYELGPAAKTWDEFSPTLYNLKLQLSTGDSRNTIMIRTVRTVAGGSFQIDGVVPGDYYVAAFDHPDETGVQWDGLVGAIVPTATSVRVEARPRRHRRI